LTSKEEKEYREEYLKFLVKPYLRKGARGDNKTWKVSKDFGM
jgi:hypothetical protein